MRSAIVLAMIAGTLIAVPASALAQAGSDEAGDRLQRVESATAGLALSFPSGWSIDVKMERDDTKLPDEVGASGGARAWAALSATSGLAFVSCSLTWFGDMPMSAAAHAELIAERLASDADATVESMPVQLPAADATRIIYRTNDGNAMADGYILGTDTDHYYLSCLDMSPFEDDLMPIAQSIELTHSEPAPEPARIASLDAFTGFSSVVEVGDGLLMSADCELALWAELEDETFREWLSCELSQAPVVEPELQGTWPSDYITTSGGACEWISDYWSASEVSEVWATSYELTVTPDGRVFGTSTYGTETLDCSGE